ncbi:MAG: FAD:protein FMN transferase [Methylococcales bacterium]|nr:FAD:protein FMN transferase [Methylococcales bacterium]
MGGPCEIRLYAENKAEGHEIALSAKQEILRLATKYSRYQQDTITSRINQLAGTHEKFKVDDETSALLTFADTCFKQSDGLFDITSGVLRRVWDFKKNHLPTQQAVEDLLPLIGWQKIQWNSPYIQLPVVGMEIDFGGFVKEYAADAAANICINSGIKHGLINLAGDIHVIGPHPDGSGWRIGIRHPRQPDQAITTIECHHGALASSGDYERFILVDNKRYSHILNPRTGWPENELASVSIVADQCIVAGASATIAILKGKAGIQWLNELSLKYYCIDWQGKVFNM